MPTADRSPATSRRKTRLVMAGEWKDLTPGQRIAVWVTLLILALILVPVLIWVIVHLWAWAL